MYSFQDYFKKRSYFEGWYLKHQVGEDSIAFIPACHADREGRRTASIQLITGRSSCYFSFPEEEFHVYRRKGIFQPPSGDFHVRIGDNLFSRKGIRIRLRNEDCQVYGTLRYSALTRLKGDIMGPFRFLPFMQCRHGVLSMGHRLKGNLNINGTAYDFTGGTGYIEKDSGSSFPASYIWTQCSTRTGGRFCSLMVAIADIPLGLFGFKGCICAIRFGSREYRLASYLGARILKAGPKEVLIRQGRYLLHIKRMDGGDMEGQKLQAPISGSMGRLVKENIACKAYYRFMENGKVIFEFTDDRASYEASDICNRGKQLP